MLSYRHAFHAGNHADVFKHLVLTLLVRSLLNKDKPFFYLDTHAGAGRYHLNSEMAKKNREFDTGIGKLWREHRLPDVVQPYMDAVRMTNPGRELHWYPGSPRVVRPWLRESDRVTLCELHPSDASIITTEFAGDRLVRIETVDGYHALKAMLPPPERRGLIHIDPPYELRDERRRVLNAVSEGYRRWATGIYAIWYPIQDRATADDFLRRFKRLGIPKVLAAELCIQPNEPLRLNGSGMIIINPPWLLESQLKEALPWLWEKLASGGEGRWRVEWLAGERPPASNTSE